MVGISDEGGSEKRGGSETSHRGRHSEGGPGKRFRYSAWSRWMFSVLGAEPVNVSGTRRKAGKQGLATTVPPGRCYRLGEQILNVIYFARSNDLS